MSTQKKSGSCFGLFLKSFLGTGVCLSLMTAVVVALGVQLLGWPSGPWTEVSAWNSRPLLAAYSIGATSFCLAFVVSGFIGLATAFLGKGGGSSKSSRSTSRSKSRPQSSRKTTV